VFQVIAVAKIKTHILCPLTPLPPNCAVYEAVWKNMVHTDRPRQATVDNLIWHMYFAYWLTKATDTHSDYVIFNAFIWQQCRSQWPHGLRCRSTAARLLRSWVRIPLGHGCLSVVSVVCCQVEVSVTI